MTDRPLYVHTLDAVQLALGLVFLASVAPKVRDLEAFGRSLTEYRLVPTALAPGVAGLVVASEAFLAVALIGGLVPSFALPLGVALLAAFAVGVAINLGRGRRIACGCFGRADETISVSTLLRLVLLLLAAAVLAVFDRRTETPLIGVGDLWAAGTAGLSYLVETAALAVFIVLGATWIRTVSQIVALTRARPSTHAGNSREVQ